MTNFTNRLLMAAAALVASAGLSSAQTLTAKVPFDFQVGGQELPAGTQVFGKLASGSPVYKISNPGARKNAAFIGQAPSTPKADSQERLVFECGPESCVLTELWTSEYGYRVPHKNSARDQEARQLSVLLTHSAD